MEKKIAVLRGDGIGPEVVNESIKVLERVAQKFGHTFHYYDIIGGVAGLEAYGDALRPQDYELGRSCDSILFGSVGDPRKYTFTGANGTKKYPSRKEAAVKALASFRRGMELFANIRPARTYPGVKSRVGEADVIVLRENSEGSLPDRNMYKGLGEFMPTPDMAISLNVCTRKATERLAHEAFRLAMKRRKKLTIVHKANVIKMPGDLFRSIIKEIGAREYPEVQIDDYHIDAMSAHMVRRLKDFDVIITTNLFGDILSDLAGELTGSLGLGPAINTNDHQCMAQAAHGSAPDIAGRNIANPVGIMLSAVMMYDWLADRYQDDKLEKIARLMENGIIETMKEGCVTPDLGGSASRQKV